MSADQSHQSDQPDQHQPDSEETNMDAETNTDQEQSGPLTPADFDADTGELLLNEVREALGRYVILPDEHAATGVVLWIAATHAVPAWAHAARLVIRAPEKRCGKSRLLDLVEAMCHDPLLTVNASPSAVFRSIGMKKNNPPTILLDEADTDLDRALRLAMADAGVRTVALNASKLPPAAKETLIALAKHLQKQQKTRNKD